VATVHFYWIGAVPAMVFLGLVMMPFYYGAKVRSVPEYLRLRFNNATHALNAATFAIATVLIAGVNLFALALIVHLMLGWSISTAILVAAAIVMAYITLGGLTSAIYNEVLQFFIIVASLLPLTLIALHDMGGWGGLQDKVRESALGEEGLHAWQGLAVGNVTNPIDANWIAIVFGLGFVLSFGYWTTNFAEVQRALSARDMNSARLTPIIGAYPKLLIPFVIIVPGLIASQIVSGLGGSGDLQYNNTIPWLIQDLLPNGVLGIAMTGLLAAFMAGMAANVSSFNTVFTYDIWQDWIKPGREDHYYLKVGRAVTVGGCVIAIFTAYLAGSFSNLMDYIQALASFFNAPLFAIFIFGLFYKKMTGTAGWVALLSGVATAVLVDLLVRGEIINVSSQAGSFMGASAAFIVGCLVAFVVSQFTPGKTDEELSGLTWATSTREQRGQGAVAAEDAGWYKNPVIMGTIVLILTLVLYIIWW
jgi:solute:Na+ symporter, SSS family